MLTTITWSGLGDGTTFNSGANWIGGAVPGPMDDAVINVASGVTINLPPSGVTLDSLTQNGGTLNFPSGTIATTTGMKLSNLNFVDDGPSITAPSGTDAFEIYGTSTLIGTISASQTVHVEGINSAGNSNLTMAAGSVNLGTILLQSANGSTFTSNLAAASGSTFTNTSTITVGASINASTITGSFTNQAAINVVAGATVIAGSAGLTFIQQSGTLTANGTFLCSAGTFLINGGTVSGNVIADGCALDLASSITSATNVYSVGANTTLITNDTTLGMVSVQGSNLYGNATLTLPAGSVNLGTILLQSASGSASTSNLAVASGTTFANTSIVTVGASTNPSELTGNFTNQGTFNVLSGATLDAGSAGTTFTQQSGILNAAGTLICNEGTLLFNGGSVSGNIFADDCYLDVASTITSAVRVYSIGGGTTLVANASFLGMITVQGNAAYGNATLTLPASSENLGTILLQSATGSASTSNLAVPGNSTFINAATINVGASTNPITISGNFTNQGTMDVQANATLDVGGAGATFTQQSGSLNVSVAYEASGTMLCNGGMLLISGGSVSGNVEAENCNLEFTSTLTSSANVDAIGGGVTLLDDDSTSGMVTVDGTSMYGTASLTLPSGSVNLGTIVLEATSGTSSTSNLAITGGSTFFNAGTIIAYPIGYPNPIDSTISGSFTNEGTINVQGGATLDVGGPGVTFTQQSGTIDASGTLISDGGSMMIDGGSVSGSVVADACLLELGNALSSTANVLAVGGTTLLGNDSTYGVVTVQGNNSYANGTLMIPSGTINLGTIVLQSAGGSLDTSNLSIASGSTFTNQGTVAFYSSINASTLTGNFRNQGQLVIAGASVNLSEMASSLVNLPGGVVNAWGTLDVANSTFTNNGTLSIDTGAAAALEIAGSYTQTSTGSVDFELAGTTAGTLYDQLNVSGPAVLAGSVNVALINKFAPSLGDSYEVMTFSSASGTFATYNGTNLMDGLLLTPSQQSTVLTLTAILAPIADLGVTDTAGPPTLPLGGSITYTVTVTNNGPNTAQSVVLTDDLPANASGFSIAVTSGTYTVSGGVVAVDISSITVGGTVTLTIMTTPSSPGTYVDSTTVASTYSYDPNPANNTASASSVVYPIQADLAVGVTAQPAQVNLGGNATYVVTLTNLGPLDAQGVSLTDTFPSGASLVSVTSSVGTPTVSGNLITLSLMTLANSGVVTLTIVVTPLSTGSVTDITSVTDTSPPDPNLANNTASTTTLVVGPVSSVTVSAGSPQSAVVGSVFVTSLQATVEDQEGDPIAGVVVTFTAPGSGVGGSFFGSQTATATTNAQGLATAPAFIAGTTLGSYVVTATVAGVATPASFSLTNIVGSASSISVTSGSSQSTVVGSTFASAFQVMVEDQYGNPVPGVVVTFAAPGDDVGGNFSGSLTVTATTNAAGLAMAPSFTAGILVGSYVVTATVAGVAIPASFSLTNTVGATSMIISTAGASQSAGVGTIFPSLLQATVEDQYGNPVPGVVVTFTAPGSGVGGSFASGKTVTVTTDAQGEATAPSFTAGSSLGSYVVVASVSGVASTASFNLTNVVGSPSIIAITAGSPQSTVVGTTFANAFQAIVEDRFGDPIAGVVVTFTAPSSGVGGSFSGSQTVTATTNAQGLATAPNFTAGTVSGSYAVTASVLGVATSAMFSLTNAAGPASTVAATAGTTQSAVVGTVFASALQVTVKDQYGNPVPGVVVTFTAPGSGVGGKFAGLTTATATTNAQGLATAPSFTAGTTLGSYTVLASVSGLATSTTFHLTNTVGSASTLMATAGTPQSATVASAFSSAFQVTVEDQYGNPVPGVVVTFTAPSTGPGGKFAGSSTATATTNAQGLVTAPSFTASTVAGSYVVVASVSGVATSATFNLTNNPAVASSVVATSGTPQSTVVGTAFATPLQVAVEDQYGNPIAGATVTFTAPSIGPGGKFAGSSTATATTNAQGLATAPSFTAGTLKGSYVVTATASNLASVASFSLANAAGLASAIAATAGTPQSAAVGSAFGSAFQVTVDDQYGNPVPGVVVTFTAPSSGPGGKFAGSQTTTATATTNASGIATAPSFTAGTAVGSFVVLATAFGASTPASFSLTSTATTMTTLVIQPSPAPLGSVVTITATVALVAPATGQATGSVSFFDGTKLLGSATLNGSGHAVLTTSTLGLGTHSITATYAGLAFDSGSVSPIATLRVGGHVAGDYDGDGKSDIALYDATTATFYIQYSGGGSLVLPFGNPSHVNIPVVGNFDGQGKTDVAIYDQTAAIFYIRESGGVTITLPFGNSAHKNIPVAGDFDGDGKTDVAIYDQTAATFYIQKSAGGPLIVLPYGNPSHINIPIAGDYDGDGKTDVAIYDQTAATFYIQKSAGGPGIILPYGNPSHINIPIAGDYDGDGKTDFSIYDQTAATFYIQKSSGGSIAAQYGNPADVNLPIPLDLDGDGKTDFVIYDQTAAEFYALESGGGNLALPFGTRKHATTPI